MLLIVIVLGMVSLRPGEDDSAKLRNEARRLAMLLQTAQEEAILLGQTIAVTIEPKSYYFSVLEDGKYEPPENEHLGPRPLPEGMKFSSVIIEGVTETEEAPRLLVPSTGEVAPFTFILKLGEHRWRLEGEFGGEIKSSEPEPEKAWRHV